MEENKLQPGDKVWHPLTGAAVVVHNNQPLGEVVRVIEPFQSPENPGLVEVQLSQPTSWPRPIPVSERLPEPLTRVLVDHSTASDGWVTAVWHDDDEEWWEATEYVSRVRLLEEVHHWMPLPPLPPMPPKPE